MVYANPLRDSFTHPVVGEGSQLVDGQLMVPQGPGLGIEIDRDMLARHRIA
jgi:L-alanine-DL-glutamate epimerase-like enolase superfamily enzyme